MSTEENKARFRRYIEQFVNQGNPAAVDELTTPDYRVHVAGQPQSLDREGLKQFLAMFRAAFPDLRDSIEDLIAEGDRLVARGTTTGTQHGEFLGVPPTGTAVRASWIAMVRFTPDGKAAEAWLNFDMLGLLQQVGAIPAPQPAQA